MSPSELLKTCWGWDANLGFDSEMVNSMMWAHEVWCMHEYATVLRAFERYEIHSEMRHLARHSECVRSSPNSLRMLCNKATETM